VSAIPGTLHCRAEQAPPLYLIFSDESPLKRFSTIQTLTAGLFVLIIFFDSEGKQETRYERIDIE